jgi:Domain of unknown function (DUF4149)
MPVLRFAAAVALAIWLGGLIALGAVAAPSIFDVIAARQIAEGRALSGAIFGEALRRFHLLAYACGAVMGLSLLLRAALGPRPPRFAWRVALTAIMLSATLYSGLVVSAKIAGAQQAIGAGVSASSLPDGDPRRAAFGRLHGQSSGLHLAVLVVGLGLLFLELED